MSDFLKFLQRTPEDTEILSGRIKRLTAQIPKPRTVARADCDRYWSHVERVETKFWSDHNWYSPHA